jgi:hypothetical protein
MAGKVRSLSPDTVRLRRNVLEPLQRLAHLAGVSVSEVVEFVLMEVLHDDPIGPAQTTPLATDSKASAPLHRKPATVIPLVRARPRRVPALLARLREVDLARLRQRAVEAREHARMVRQRAESACRSAANARLAAAHLVSESWR